MGPAHLGVSPPPARPPIPHLPPPQGGEPQRRREKPLGAGDKAGTELGERRVSTRVPWGGGGGWNRGRGWGGGPDTWVPLGGRGRGPDTWLPPPSPSGSDRCPPKVAPSPSPPPPGSRPWSLALMRWGDPVCVSPPSPCCHPPHVPITDHPHFPPGGSKRPLCVPPSPSLTVSPHPRTPPRPPRVRHCVPSSPRPHHQPRPLPPRPHR